MGGSDGGQRLARAIGEQIAERRRSKGLSQEGLARMAGMSRETVRRAEAGERMPRWVTLAKLAECLDIRLTDLVALATAVEHPTSGGRR
ncbi:MAG TPA: helix-turn-helix transcriptional regulator [Actinomycetota bacterium]|nr:helix-turn-helix transcriptional regulator [Actinomycetota bacterium]